eukprot:IDg6513t1
MPHLESYRTFRFNHCSRSFSSPFARGRHLQSHDSIQGYPDPLLISELYAVSDCLAQNTVTESEAPDITEEKVASANVEADNDDDSVNISDATFSFYESMGDKSELVFTEIPESQPALTELSKPAPRLLNCFCANHLPQKKLSSCFDSLSGSISILLLLRNLLKSLYYGLKTALNFLRMSCVTENLGSMQNDGGVVSSPLPQK